MNVSDRGWPSINGKYKNLDLSLYYLLIFVRIIIRLSKVRRKEENVILTNFDEITFVS